MLDAVSMNSGVETPDAPEWLSKLENRREKLTRGKLGHEAGAGAPCSECGEKCPGLDLHFWRKVCRNCKCRKDQHMCVDEDLSGWAQFEILGQIRSKPAFIKIKALANQPVRLEWVPPNVAIDVVSDYMEKLGTSKIPIFGSDAATRRKQQLEFQVPPHDLDATLCDNLTASEADQLLQYVEKIRENCVGQGNVVRVGKIGQAFRGHFLQNANVHEHASNELKTEYVEVMNRLPKAPAVDATLHDILTSEELRRAIITETATTLQNVFDVISEGFIDSPIEFASAHISDSMKSKLRGLNPAVVHSVVQNGRVYDKILHHLQDKHHYDISQYRQLQAIADFRSEWLHSAAFRHEIDAFCTTFSDEAAAKAEANIQPPFNSPVTIKNAILTRFSAQVKQDTPMRRIRFGAMTLINDLGLPHCIDYDNDKVFASVLNSDQLKGAMQGDKLQRGVRVVVADCPLSPDFMDETHLSAEAKAKLNAMVVDSTCLQSFVVNETFYVHLFDALDKRGIVYGSCNLLGPLRQLRDALFTDKRFNDEVRVYVAQMPSATSIAYGGGSGVFRGTLMGSRSFDSGFGSKPSTPNYSTHPGLATMYDNITITSSKFVTVPGIEEMNMYPDVQPSAIASLSQALHETQLQEPMHHESIKQPSDASANGNCRALPALLKCCECHDAINFGEVAVKAERAGKEMVWHPQCFKCHTCHELLADLVYFFHGGNVYCGRDLAIKLKIPRCRACDELIFTKEYTAAEGATFHIKHFCCYQCDTPLAGQQYVPDEKSNMPLCLRCYEEFFAAHCQCCQRPIGPSDQGVAWENIHWHGRCFICVGRNCAKSLIGGRFCVKNQRPYCSPTCVRSVMN